MATFKSDDFEIERVEETFGYEADSGAKYTLADPKALRPEVLFELDQHGAEHMLLTLLDFDEKAYKAFLDEDEMDGYLLDAVMTAWRRHYGLLVEPGKGRASRKPSDRLEKKSKRTSRTGTQA